MMFLVKSKILSRYFQDILLIFYEPDTFDTYFFLNGNFLSYIQERYFFDKS